VSGDAVAALMVDWYCWVDGWVGRSCYRSFSPAACCFCRFLLFRSPPLCLTLFPWDIYQIALSLSLSCSLALLLSCSLALLLSCSLSLTTVILGAVMMMAVAYVLVGQKVEVNQGRWKV
jgi:hypothetical protein